MNLLKLQSFFASVVVLSALGLAHPVAAANWGNCSVESATTTIADTTTNTTITPSTTVTDTTQAFVIASATGDVNVRRTKDHLVTAELLSTGSVEFERGGSVGDLQIAYSIIQCQDDDKINVQRGDINISGGVASDTAALTTAVDTSYSLVTVTVSSNDSATGDSSSLVTAALQDASTVVAQRAAASTSKISAHYQVIEFPAATAGVSVQTSETTLTAGSDTTTATLTTAVATDRTWVYCSYDATDNGLQQTAVGCALTDASTVTVYRYAASAYTNRVRVYAVTWPGDTVTVLSGTDSVDPTVADGNQFTHSITLSDPGADISRSFPYVTNTTAGTDTKYPRNRWGSYLQDSDTLEIVFWRSDSAGSTDAANFYWQVINFPSPYQATGWGWIGSSTDAIDGTALISFSCENLTAYTLQDCGDGTAGTRYDYGVTLERGGCGDTCDVSGQAWIGETYAATDPIPSPIGIIDFDPDVSSGPPVTIGDDTTTIEDESLNAHWNEETGEVYGWARFLALADYDDVLGGTDNDWGWIRLRGTESTGGSEYGVQFDADTLEFSGWSWNDNGTQVGSSPAEAENGSGFGWVKFDLDTSVGTVGDAWLRTTQADVYSQQGFDMTTAAPSGEYNATYLIITSGDTTTISAFSTQDPLLEDEGINTDLGSVPTDSTATTQVFRGDLGTIYVNELIGQFDYTQTDPCTESLLSAYTNPLGGNIFYCPGSMTISNNLTFYNGTGNNIGSGTVVVDGDLYINDNLNYFNSTIDQHINNLASVAWIVTGRVILDPAVTELVGAFIVLGDAHATATDPYDFDTGSSTLPLTLHGLVMARSFNFQRTSVGTTSDPEPGEDIRYDGRVFANPPPGLEDLASLLPEFD